MRERVLGRLVRSLSGRRLGSAAAALLVLGVALVSQAQAQNSAAKPAPVKRTAPAAQKSAPRGLNTAIKVHGHWVIDVKNPDGTVAQHREFENSLVTGGAGDTILANVLTASVVPATWAVILPGACTNASDGGPDCELIQASGPVSGACYPGSITIPPACSVSLSVAAGGVGCSGCGATSVVMSGALLNAPSGQITEVRSFLYGCPLTNGSMSPTCGTNGFTPFSIESSFTDAKLANAIPVVGGQTIQVNVTFTFD